jgi:hypothetical protein
MRLSSRRARLRTAIITRHADPVFDGPREVTVAGRVVLETIPIRMIRMRGVSRVGQAPVAKAVHA